MVGVGFLRHVRSMARRTPTTALPGLGSRRAILRLFIHLLVNGSLVLVISGIGHALAHPVRNQSPEVGEAVHAVVDRHAVPTSVPADFEDLLGYRPAVESGTLSRPDGTCSTPFGLGPPSFESACRTHDLGYDLLRYAEAKDGRLGAWARFELDRRLYQDLVRRCRTAGCRATAAVYFVSLTGNSVRQGFRAPEREPGLPWAALGIAVVGVSVGTSTRRSLAARRRLLSLIRGIRRPEPIASVRVRIRRNHGLDVGVR